MTREELQTILAGLRMQNPDVRIELRPGLRGGHYEIDLHLPVVQDLYLHPQDSTPVDETRAQIQEEIAAFIEATSPQTRAQHRQARFRREGSRILARDLPNSRVLRGNPDLWDPPSWAADWPPPETTAETTAPASEPVERPVAVEKDEQATLWERLEES